MEYLGNIITGSKMSTEPTKVASIQEWVLPQTIKLMGLPQSHGILSEVHTSVRPNEQVVDEDVKAMEFGF